MKILFYGACMVMVFVNGVLVGGYLAGLGITARTFRPSWTLILVDSGFAVWFAFMAREGAISPPPAHKISPIL